MPRNCTCNETIDSTEIELAIIRETRIFSAAYNEIIESSLYSRERKRRIIPGRIIFKSERKRKEEITQFFAQTKLYIFSCNCKNFK